MHEKQAIEVMCRGPRIRARPGLDPATAAGPLRGRELDCACGRKLPYPSDNSLCSRRGRAFSITRSYWVLVKSFHTASLDA